jgi:hypothetical protein
VSILVARVFAVVEAMLLQLVMVLREMCGSD